MLKIFTPKRITHKIKIFYLVFKGTQKVVAPNKQALKQ